MFKGIFDSCNNVYKGRRIIVSVLGSLNEKPMK